MTKVAAVNLWLPLSCTSDNACMLSLNTKVASRTKVLSATEAKCTYRSARLGEYLLTSRHYFKPNSRSIDLTRLHDLGIIT
jgi:hypothetical protein